MNPVPARAGGRGKRSARPMPQSKPEPERVRSTGALLVYGSDVSKETFEMLSVQLELLLGELDRSMAGADSARFEWQTLGRSYRGDRVLIGPDPVPDGRAAGVASHILERVRWGISVITGGPRRPPVFADLALKHLE